MIWLRIYDFVSLDTGMNLVIHLLISMLRLCTGLKIRFQEIIASSAKIMATKMVVISKCGMAKKITST